MVVAKLQSYFEQIPGAMYSANLRELINEETSCGGEPTVVLDESASRRLFNSKSFPIYNGQPRICRNKIERFVENIISCRVNLIVVIRGNETYDRIKWYFKLRNEFKQNEKQILNAAKEGRNFEFSFLSGFCAKTTFASIKNKHYTVLTSIANAHEEVAKIAVEQNCLAVIGQDSNYLIYEGIRFYISINSMNPETLDCSIYDRNKLIEHLGLTSYQLPLFATLCGNDIVPVTHLEDFHKTVSPSNGDKFLGIAQVVRGTSASPYKHIKEVVLMINHPQINEDLISESLDMYLKFDKRHAQKSKWRVFADERKSTNQWGATLHQLLLFKEIGFSSVTGFFEPGSISPVALLRPLRKKIYGILLYEDDFPIVKEYCFEELLKSQRKYPVPTEVFALKPECEHPGLVQLWNKDAPNIKILKWGLFCSPFDKTLSDSNLRIVPKKLLFPTIALHYLYVQVPLLLRQTPFKEKFELELFLVVALLLEGDLEETLLENWQCNETDPHLSYLSCCFIETCHTLNLLNEACGLVVPKQDCCICNFYDGILMQYVYQKVKEGAKWEEFFEGRTSLEVTFYTLMEIILENCDQKFASNF